MLMCGFSSVGLQLGLIRCALADICLIRRIIRCWVWFVLSCCSAFCVCGGFVLMCVCFVGLVWFVLAWLVLCRPRLVIVLSVLLLVCCVWLLMCYVCFVPMCLVLFGCVLVRVVFVLVRVVVCSRCAVKLLLCVILFAFVFVAACVNFVESCLA